MIIKQIIPSEYQLVVDLFNSYRIFYKQSSDPIRAEQFIKTRLDNNESVIFVALEEINGSDISVGFTQLYPTYSSVRAVKNWILNDLFVEPGHRKKGVARKLIHAALSFARHHEAKYIQLETSTDNLSAQKLYEDLGFIKQQPDADYFLYKKAIE